MIDLSIASLLSRYRRGEITPASVMAEIRRRSEACRDDNIWIHPLSADEVEPWLQRLEGQSPDSLPLYGIPFAIKDNIDLAGIPTTAGCPEYAYIPKNSSLVVQRLLDAGAIPVGKSNLDQFATGLVGTRSPFGATRNSMDPTYISGGSSSGSAVSVAKGLASFSLGTDTAGSGRVPAAFNNLIGIKPTKGLLSTSGVVPACRSLDCVSIFALNLKDGETLLKITEGYDAADAYSRKNPVISETVVDSESFTFGVPQASTLEFFGNSHAEALYYRAVEKLEAGGGKRVDIDFAPFLETARLLYEGPWVAERYVAIEDFIETHADALWPVTRAIIEPGRDIGAVDAFKAMYRLEELRQVTAEILAAVDCVVTPTAGTIYTLAEVEADPIRLNSNLGYYTNFMNLLDLSALAVPAGFQPDGLPFGITLFAPAFYDRALLALGRRVLE
ncbi:allophanate hydrolase [Mariprofundus ferrooxydans]|uniref:allophanate hydrolase n=1 Tax=Mariprofundus ferrooxydans TaxID=314344 RepID=UPI000368621D|nr:allophanate hydrolase [Mariprofundus ferrooxydans]